MSQLAQHFHVVGHTLVQTFGFVGLSNLFKIGHLLGQIIFNLMNGAELFSLVVMNRLAG